MDSSQKDAAYWKKKYRDLLRENESKRGDNTEELQQAIEKLARTAALLDKQLADGLNPVYQQAKRKAWGRPGQLALLEQTLDNFQRQLSLTREREKTALAEVQSALSAFPLDGASKKNLKLAHKLFAKQAFANEWAPVLEALSNLKPVPAQAAGDKPGLLAGLFGRGAAADQSASSAAETESPKVDESQAADDETAHTPAAGSEFDTKPDAKPDTESRPIPAADTGPAMGISGELIEHPSGPVHEPAFSKISDRISRVLGDLLAQIEPEPNVADKAEAAKTRIDKGLNWYELVPTLEDIRDLVMALLINAKQDYRQYLLHLLEQINQMITMAGSAVEAASAVVNAEEQLIIDLDSEVGAFDQAIQSISDVTELKQVIEARVQSLASVISQRKIARAAEDGAVQKIQTLEKTIAQLREEAQQRQAELESQRQKARTDNLTGLPNREAYNERLHHEIERFRRYNRALTLVVCDIDHFKKFNDDYSHQVGDRVLKVVSNAIQKQLRDVDFMARYGGEEFVVLFPETEGPDGLTKMERIRAAVAATKFKFKDQHLAITFSAGLAQARAGDTGSQLFARADQALYKAKAAGRNRCLVDDAAAEV